MTVLIKEDGAMPEGANCYAVAIEVDAWQAARGAADWPPAPAGGDDPELAAKEGAILKATDYLNGLPWKGRRAAPGRIIAWPRLEVEDADGYVLPPDEIPAAVVAANCYLAGLLYGGVELQPILERGGAIQVKSIGKLSKTYFPNATARDVASGLADLLRGLVYGLDAYAGIGDKKSISVNVVNLEQG